MTKISMKAFLAFVAIAPVCTAFTAPSIINTRSATTTSPQTTSFSRLNSLSAFKFPFPAQKNDAVEETIEEISTTATALIEPITEVCILTLRLSTCALMIHHGFDKIQNVEGFSANVVAKFFGFLPGNPSFWTLSAAGTQVVGSVLLALGILSRPIAFSMMMTMVVAVVFHFLNTGLEGFPLAVVSQHSYNYELAAMYVGVLAYFSASGAGIYSVDETVFGGELQLYDSAIGKLVNQFSGEEEVKPEEVPEKKNAFQLPW